MGCDSRKSSDPIKPDKFLVFPGSKIPVPGSANVRQESTGKNVVFGRKAPEHPGKWKQHSGRKIFKFFPGAFQRTSCSFHQETAASHQKKSEKFPTGILLPSSGIFQYFPIRTSPYSLTCVSFRYILYQLRSKNPFQSKFHQILLKSDQNQQNPVKIYSFPVGFYIKILITEFPIIFDRILSVLRQSDRVRRLSFVLRSSNNKVQFYSNKIIFS